ncbi:hypothetical protein BGW38_001775 [Lunasporangiospora selenospora]|uniref:UBA domain-containing protein n=1 Tax=Lunasporangiospora selenospora TaxID=979761 RepID=A0A9P6FTQ1_9FUNG|nr:hypothetical protein BGW38_001775 [Lunasporangiospora selenospora]
MFLSLSLISAMEQYIRSKYERKEFMEGGGNSQPSSRSAYGNTFSGGYGTSRSNNDIINTSSYTAQMSALRAMGFTDNAKSLQVLQSTNGDVPNAVEILCRIGSGPVSPPVNRSSTPTQRSSPRPSNNNNSNSNPGSDPKEAMLWNMGFHDVALNKEALRRAGGNPEVAAALLIDEKDKLAKAVKNNGSSSPLPARLEPPRSSSNNNSSSKNEDLLLDLSTPDDNPMQQQQQLQQRMMQQQQMQMQMQMNQPWGNQNPGMDQFGQNHNQLQSILDKNANILSLFGNDGGANNNNNNNNYNNMMQNNNLGNPGMSNMNSAFGLQQNQMDSNSWATQNNTNTNNSMPMNSAFGFQTSMPTGVNNMNMNQGMGLGMGMTGAQHSPMNPFGMTPGPMQNSGMMGMNVQSATTGMGMSGGIPATNSAFGVGTNQFGGNPGLGAMGSASPVVSPFGTTTATSMNTPSTMGMGAGMNMGMGMGMGMGMNPGMNTANSGMNTGMGMGMGMGNSPNLSAMNNNNMNNMGAPNNGYGMNNANNPWGHNNSSNPF